MKNKVTIIATNKLTAIVNANRKHTTSEIPQCLAVYITGLCKTKQNKTLKLTNNNNNDDDDDDDVQLSCAHQHPECSHHTY